MAARVSCSSSSSSRSCCGGIASSNSNVRAASSSAAAKPLPLLRPRAASPPSAGHRSFASRSNRQRSIFVARASKSPGDRVEPTFRVSGELLSSAPPALVWEVLTDYDGAASIFGNVSESRVLGPLSEHRRGESSGESSPAAAAAASSAASAAASPASASSTSSSSSSPFLSAPFEPSAIEQFCSWKFLLFGGSFKMRLGVEEGPSSFASSSSSSSSSDSDAGEERSLVFSLLEPGFVRAFEGVWSVAVVDDEEEEGGGGGWSDSGSSSDSGRKTRKPRTVVRHSLGVTPAVPPPAPVRPVVRKLFQKQVASLLDDLERELERRMK